MNVVGKEGRMDIYDSPKESEEVVKKYDLKDPVQAEQQVVAQIEGLRNEKKSTDPEMAIDHFFNSISSGIAGSVYLNKAGKGGFDIAKGRELMKGVVKEISTQYPGESRELLKQLWQSERRAGFRNTLEQNEDGDVVWNLFEENE